MALDELERKLNESFIDLRTENKNLIELLKLRQTQLKGCLEPKPSNITNKYINSKSKKSYPHQSELLSSLYERTKHASQTLPYTLSNNSKASTVISQADSGSSKAREMLSLRSKENSEQLYTVTFQNNEECYKNMMDSSSEEETDTYTSTPNITPIKSTQASLSSPKSILKRRKIIDDNVRVQSKFKHTPVSTSDRARNTGLHFSYEDETENNDSEILNGSFLGVEHNESRQTGDKPLVNYMEHRMNKKKLDDDMRNIENLIEQKLLDAPGNDRQHANVVKNIDQRPKNSLFDLNEKTITEERRHIQIAKKTSPFNPIMNPTREGRPLLGYDWIAGVLENEGIMTEQSEGLFNEIEEFRRKNREECVGSASVWDKNLDLRRPVSPEIDDPGHTCIHGFTLNDRLFTSSINLNEEGESICPVCLVARKPPTREDPAFVRVSIPRSTIAAPYKVIPHTRKSFDPTDSYALSQHCLAGWQNAKPYTLPTASTLDLKDKVIPKQTTTYDEAREVAETFSRMGRLYQGKNMSDDKIAKELTSRTNSLRYELEIMREGLGHNLKTKKI